MTYKRILISLLILTGLIFITRQVSFAIMIWLILESRYLLFGNSKTKPNNPQGRSRSREEFRLGLLALSALVIKADGHTHQNELDYVRHRFVQWFGQEQANYTFRQFNKNKMQMQNPEGTCRQLNRFIGYHARLQIVHYLFSTATADGSLNRPEHDLISQIASLLRISRADFLSISAMFTQQKGGATTLENAYRILEITPSATDEEVKKAYRRLALMHHPDKLADMGPSVQEEGRKKFLKIQEAYEKIKQARGMN